MQVKELQKFVLILFLLKNETNNNKNLKIKKVNLLMRAGLAPTCLWLRRGQKNPQVK